MLQKNIVPIFWKINEIVKSKLFLLIQNGEGCCYFAVKQLSTLFRETSKHHGEFCCLNCLHYFVTENKRESHEKACENKKFCNIAMSSEDTKILEFNQNPKFDKSPFIIYAECWMFILNF